MAGEPNVHTGESIKSDCQPFQSTSSSTAPPQSNNGRSLTSRLPSLDGWRAVSIALVLGSHSPELKFPRALRPLWVWLFDGDLGVRFFFTISGFLITWLMVIESNRFGRISLKNFYVRRSLRILPVYFAFLIVIAGLEVLTPFTQAKAVWVGNLTFTRNFVPNLAWASPHLWSLSVEEQFYLIWPCVFLLSGVAANFQRSLVVLSVPMLLGPLFRVLSYLNAYPPVLSPLFSRFSFFNYFDCLAVGCACAFLLTHKSEILRQSIADSRVAPIVAGALIIIPYVLGKLSLLGIIMAPFGRSMQACGFAVLVLQSVICPTWGLYRVLNWPGVCRVGVLSYSLYIWHMIFCTPPWVFDLGHVWWMSFPWWLVPVAVVAAVSYYGLERPLLGLRLRFRRFE